MIGVRLLSTQNQISPFLFQAENKKLQPMGTEECRRLEHLASPCHRQLQRAVTETLHLSGSQSRVTCRLGRVFQSASPQ